MSINPREIPTGAVRYNTDSNKMEVYIGDTWMEVAVSSPNLGDSSSPAGTRGLFFGEFDDSSNTPTIDYVTISSTGNAVDYGDIGYETGSGCPSGYSDSHGGLGGY